jgi:hypothetical protein
MRTQTQPQATNTFGPLGLLYVSVVGGIVMFFVTAILFFLIPVVGAFLAWIICIIWAIVAVQNSITRQSYISVSYNA